MNPLEELSKKSGVSLSSINDGSLNTAALSSMMQEPAQATTTPTPSPINRSITQPTTSPAEQYLNTFQAPESVSQIADRKRKESQGLIDSVKELYAGEFQAVEDRRAQRLAEQNASSVLSGTAGSGQAYSARDTVNVQSDKEKAAKQAELTSRLQSIYSKISTEASQEALEQKANATAQAESIVKRDEEKQARAKENLKLMATAGTDYDSFKSNPQNQQVYDYALRTFDGNETALKSYFTLNRPVDQVVERKFEGNQLLQIWENPITGKQRIETVNLSDLGLEVPRGYDNAIDLGGQIMLVPKDFDPSKDTPFYINKSLTPSQSAKGATTGGTSAGGASSQSAPSQIVDANGKPIKLTAAQVDTVTGFKNTVDASQQALALLQQGVQTGPIAGRLLQVAKTLDKADPNQLQLEQLLGKIKADFMKAMSGAAVSEPEVKRLSKFLPDITDQESVIKSKLNTLMQETERSRSNFLGTLGAVNTTTEAPQGSKIRVRLSDGRTGTIDATDFDPKSMTKL